MKTIVAVATNLKDSTIGMIRISGNKAIDIINTLIKKEITKERELRNLYINGKFIDSALLNIFYAPNSFTGENIVEIMFHSNKIISDEIINKVLKEGGVLAKKGEFLEQAFLNGKTSIWKAQLVNEIIKSSSKAVLDFYRINYKSTKKNKNLTKLRDKMERILMKSDFSDEYPEYYNIEDLKKEIIINIKEIQKEILISLKQIEAIEKMERGYKIVIVGPSNVGKSTLFNSLLGKDRSIVSNLYGTTRDYIEDKYETRNGITISLVDTAGIRETNDHLEKQGIRKTNKVKKDANFTIYVDDPSTIKGTKINKKKKGKSIHIVTKKDLAKFKKLTFEEGLLFISNKEKEDISLLKRIINKNIDEFVKKTLKGELVFKSDKTLLNEISSTLTLILNEIKKGITIDVQRERLKSCLNNFNIVLGEEKSYSYLENIFRTFCIGK